MVNPGGATYPPKPVRRLTLPNGGAPAPHPLLPGLPNHGNTGGAQAPAPPHPGHPNQGNPGGAHAPSHLPPIIIAKPPAQTQAAAATQPTQPPTLPLDAQYWNSLGQAQFDAGQHVNALSTQDTDALTQRDTLRAQLAERQPILQQQATDSANAHGLLYGGALGSRLGDLATDYSNADGKLVNDYEQGHAQRTSEIGGINDGMTFQDLALQLASIDRAAKAAPDQTMATPPIASAAVPRARGHSTRYTGPGQYATVGPTSTDLRAIGHSLRYRGPGHYVNVKK